MMRMYIVEGFRTPFCKFGSILSDEPPIHFGISTAKAIFSTLDLDPTSVDETIYGCCNQPITSLANVARTISVRSGVPESVPAVTVHRNCASGFEAITCACNRAAAKKGDVFLVGGVESMSQAPFAFSYDAVKKFTALSRSKTLVQKLKNAFNFRPSDFKPQISLKLGLVDSLCSMGMGQTAELLAREYGITRKEQDQFAENSHFKALAAKACGAFDKEISPFYLTNDDCIRSPKAKAITEDNGVRDDALIDKLSRLKPVFDRNGTVTAGNASQVTDGGASMVLMTKKGLEKTGCTPIAQIVDYAYTGCDPKRMGLGPTHAITKLFEQSSKTIEDMDLIEINEAFAAQVLACLRQLDIPEERINANGGAIALGHPLAASGIRLVLSVAKNLRHKKLKNGLASLCVGGGQGGAIWIKSV
jgi:acetyl-CoA C-acetyltransferase/acetyl-CoA acyltransferase